MPIPLVIIGTGGHGREAHDVVCAINDHAREPVYEFLGFLDDAHPNADLLAARGTAFLGPVSLLPTLDAAVQYVIGIGDGLVRRRVDQHLTGVGFNAATLVHPTAVVGRANTLAPGVIVCAQAVVTTNTMVGRHTQINIGSTLSHDCVVGDYVTFSPGVHVAGNVNIGDCVLLGINSSINPGVTVGAEAIVGAGAVVIGDVKPQTTVTGVPAASRMR